MASLICKLLKSSSVRSTFPVASTKSLTRNYTPILAKTLPLTLQMNSGATFSEALWRSYKPNHFTPVSVLVDESLKNMKLSGERQLDGGFKSKLWSVLTHILKCTHARCCKLFQMQASFPPNATATSSNHREEEYHHDNGGSSRSLDCKISPFEASLVATTSKERGDGGDCNQNDNKVPVGICLKLHLHYKEEEIRAYPSYKSEDSTISKNFLKKVMCSDEKCPDFMGITLRFNLENDFNELVGSEGELNIKHITVEGKIPFSKPLPGNVFVFNGVGDCKVKC